MKQVCFLLHLKKDRIKDYIEAHQVWPELLDEMRKEGIRNYSLFMGKDGLIIGYLESDEPIESLRRVGQSDVGRRWEEYMSEYFENTGNKTNNSDAEEWIEQYFYME